MRISVLIGFFSMFVLTAVGQSSFSIAFPGAEGFGKFTSGGRGGRVIVVTNLNDSGPGSFREAVKKKEPRIIVFAVSGIIELQSPLSINYGNVTISGQSAPGDGICIKNYSVNVKADNVIIRFMRFRLGDEKSVESDAFGGNGATNVIIDHCSVSWATDECASFYRNKNFTLQWCIISESLNESVHHKGEHGYGGIWGGEKASFHHNLIANHNSRLPRFSGSSTTPNDPEHELVDFCNNVIYNWKINNIYGGERGRYNVVNNYLKAGPATKKTLAVQIVNPSSPFGKFYVNGNFVCGFRDITKNNWAGGVKAKHLDSARSDHAFEVESVSLQTAEEACEAVLRHAGASFRRDAVDERIVSEVRSGRSPSGKLKNGIIDSQRDVGGWPELKSGALPDDKDTDGIPDTWETNHGLDPANPADAQALSKESHYSNIEVYLNDIVGALVTTKR